MRRYGFIKSKPDTRDLLIKFTEQHVMNFLKSIGSKTIINNSIFDLRKIVALPQALSEMDQGQLGSCLANAISFAYAFDELKQKNKEIFLPSRLFIYWNTRSMENTINQDAGGEIRDGIKTINTYGVCDEHLWIYDILNFKTKPSAEAFQEANNSKSVAYARIDFTDDKTLNDRINHLKKSLMSGFPFVFGFQVYPNFESEEVGKTGILDLPDPDDQPIGGHAVCAVGFDDTKKSFIVKNSWGSKWGLNGYFYMPYNYTANPDLSDDFWVIQTVSDPDKIPNFTPNDINPDAENLNADINNGGVVHN